jgi:rhodanese-related sulfurtransferase
VIDVREPDEFARGTLPNAINIPHDQVLDALTARFAKDAELVLICNFGACSSQAAWAALRRGWRAHYLDGGLASWPQDGP